ncbi:abhydrolase domain-containing protein C22H12.03-like, partial [Stegodyphus dumicola]|uniref:abhydrolase domain-containing protein C22H12.03-like n=1 Tax=Stegodyphus dumicola TaxID=202533 RepID=UPI0015AFA088
MSNLEKSPKPVKINFTSYVPHDVSSQAPVIFIHGLLDTTATWDKVMKVIADRTKRKVYALGLRNHAESEWSDEFTLPALVADVEEFMKSKAISKANIVGHSVGGRIAIALALYKPEVVEKLIVEDSLVTEPPDDFLEQFLKTSKESRKEISKLPCCVDETTASDLVSQFVLQCLSKMSNEFSRVPLVLPVKKNSDGKFEFQVNLEVIEKVIEEKTCHLDLSKAHICTIDTLFIRGEKTITP